MLYKSDGVPSVPKLRSAPKLGLEMEDDSNLPEPGLETFILAKRRRRSTLRAAPLLVLGTATDVAVSDAEGGVFEAFVV